VLDNEGLQVKKVEHNIISRNTAAHERRDSIPVIVKPSSIARDNDMMGLFSDIILMKIGSLHRFSFHALGTFFFLLETHKRKANHECCYGI